MTSLHLTKGYPFDFFLPTVEYIVRTQLDDGSIPWFEGHFIDPWDHIESAMGLSIGGKIQAAERAYFWLAKVQSADGSWWAAYKDGYLDESGDYVRKESNFVAYIATGVWHHYLITKDQSFLSQMWRAVYKAINFVLDMQSTHGEIYWAIDQNGLQKDALITGNASIYKSLECAINIAHQLGHDFSSWQSARDNLGEALRNKPERFDRTWESKSRFSMDWFYPVLAGVLSQQQAKAKLKEKWSVFVEEGLGCRCVVNEPWITIAESCELVMALLFAGERHKAVTLFSWLHEYRDHKGAYWTGYVFKDKAIWPEEKPTWTAGAILLAADALTETTAAAKLFTAVNLPNTTQCPERINSV